MTNKQPGPVSQNWPDTDRSIGQSTVRGTTTGRHFYSSRSSRHWFVKWFYQTQVSTRLVLNLKYLQVSRNHMNPPRFFVRLKSRQDCMNNAKYKYGSSKGVRIQGIYDQVIVRHEIIIWKPAAALLQVCGSIRDIKLTYTIKMHKC